MSLITARKKRTSLYLSIAGLMVMVAAVSAISSRDPDGVSIRVGMIMLVTGAALRLPWRQLIPAVVLAWLAPNLVRSAIDDVTLFDTNMLLELPGLAGVAFFAFMARHSLKDLEEQNVLIGSGNNDLAGMNPETGIFDASQLKPALVAELARSRRFNRQFSLILVGIEELRQKFDYRDEALWKASLDATTQLLRQTRNNVDRVFHHGDGGFAIILPESTEKDIPGLVRRLRRLARTTKPAEGEPGGPMPVHFGATFFPDCATTVEDLLRRAEIALRIGVSNTTRYQLDGAEAPEMPPGDTLRRPAEDVEVADDVEPASGVTQAPPVIANPIAAAIVDEAYADRTREAEEVTSPSTGAVAAVLEPERLERLPAVTEVVSQPAALESEAWEPVQAWMPDEEPEDAPEATPALFVAVESPLAEAAAPEGEAAGRGVETLEPVLAGVGSSTASTMQVADAPLGGEQDELAALLRQMDETLKMIRSVRNSAA